MKKTALILSLLFIFLQVNAQVQAPSVWGKFSLSQGYGCYNREFTLFNGNKLFDLAEIKKRKIKTAYIILHPMSWAEYDTVWNKMSKLENTPPWCDTTSIYKFDDEGRIIQIAHDIGRRIVDDYDTSGYKIASTKTYQLPDGRTKTTTYKYPKDSALKKVDSSDGWTTVKSQKIGKDSLITSTTFLKVKNRFDTMFVSIDKYNAQGLLIEEEFKVHRKNYKEADLHIECGIATWHYKYDYDKEGRVTFFRDFDSTNYKKISYPFYGMLIETFDLATNLVKKREMNLLTIEKGTVKLTSNSKGQVILTPIEPSSKLYKLETFITAGDFPTIEYHEIIYK